VDQNGAKLCSTFEERHGQNKLEPCAIYTGRFSPVNIFEEIFDKDLYEWTVQETIRYATTQKNKHRYSVSVTSSKYLLIKIFNCSQREKVVLMFGDTRY
jgi:hypothetical protein